MTIYKYLRMIRLGNLRNKIDQLRWSLNRMYLSIKSCLCSIILYITSRSRWRMTSWLIGTSRIYIVLIICHLYNRFLRKNWIRIGRKNCFPIQDFYLRRIVNSLIKLCLDKQYHLKKLRIRKMRISSFLLSRIKKL